MPYLFNVDAKYNKDKGVYTLGFFDDLVSKYPLLMGNVLTGKFISVYLDGKIKTINKDFKCKVDNDVVKDIRGEILEPNPLKAIGLPLPSELLSVAYGYEVKHEQEKVELLPIAQDMVLRSGNLYRFEDEVKRILKEEEAGLILEGSNFHSRLVKHKSVLKEALISFEQENFAVAKTSCRKILEDIKQIVNDWKAVDDSQSMCEKLQKIVSSLYSFASIGGLAHEGVTTRAETELILKNTTSLLFYINFLLKNDRTSEINS